MSQSTKREQVKGSILFILFLVILPASLSADEKVVLTTNGVEIRFGALTQFWGTTSFSKERTFGSDPITFKLRRTEIRFSGDIDSSKIGWLVMVDPAERPESPLQDVYVNLNYIPKMETRLGQFKIPFSMESRTPSDQLDFIERASIIRTYADRRDIGIMLSGKFTSWEWQAGAFNGNGQNITDNNNFKDLAGRIVVQPANSFHIGGSGYWSKKPFFDYYYFPPRKQDLDSFRVAGELKIDYKNLDLRAEAIWAADEYLSFSFPRTTRKTSFSYKWGGYTSLHYRLLNKHQFGLRGEWFNPRISSRRDETFFTTIGYDFFFAPRAKWQINLQSQVYRRGTLLENLDIYYVLTNLQISF